MPGVTADDEEEERKGTNTTNTTIATTNGSNRKCKVGVFMVVGGGCGGSATPIHHPLPAPSPHTHSSFTCLYRIGLVHTHGWLYVLYSRVRPNMLIFVLLAIVCWYRYLC